MIARKESMEAKPNKIKSISPLFFPKTHDSLQGLDIPDTMVEDLVLRRLYTTGTSSLKALSQAEAFLLYRAGYFRSVAKRAVF